MATETQIDDLLFELRELTRALGTRNQTTQQAQNQASDLKSTDRSIKQLISALGLLSERIGEGSRIRGREDARIDDFTNAVERATVRQEKLENAAREQEEAQRRAAMSAEELAEENRRLGEEERKRADAKAEQEEALARQERDRERQKFREQAANLRETKMASRQTWADIQSSGTTFGNFLNNELSDRFVKGFGGSIKAVTALEGLKAASEGVVKGFMTFSSALVRGERGAQVAAKAFTDFVKPISSFMEVAGTIATVASFLLPMARAAKIALRVFSAVGIGGAKIVEKMAELNELAAKQVDDVFKSYNELAKVGAAGPGGLREIRDQLQTFGFSIAEIDKFNKIALENSKDLGLMGGTITQGLTGFARISGEIEKSDVGKELEMLGITADRLRASTLQYMTIQAKTGKLQLMSAEELKKQSESYARELQTLADLTGASVEEQQKAMEAAMAEERFRSALIDARQRAESGDEGAKEELKRLERFRDLFKMLQSQGIEAKGILQYGAGGPTTTEAIEAMQQFRLQEYGDRDMTQGQMMRFAAEGIRQNQQTLAGVQGFTGRIEGMTRDIIKSDDFQLREQKLQTEALKAGFTGETAVDDFIKAVKEDIASGKKVDKELKDMVEASRNQRAAALIQDEALASFMPAAKINAMASKTFKEAAELFARSVGLEIEGGVHDSKSTSVGRSAPAEMDYSDIAAQMEGAPIADVASSAPTTPSSSTSAATKSAAPTTPAATKSVPLPPGIAKIVGSGDLIGASSMAAAGAPPGLEVPGQAPQLSKIRELIASVESGGNYNILVGGGTAPLTNMTIAEVMQLQRQLIQEGKGSAAGKYQVIATTLNEAVGKLGLDRNQKFDESTQDKIADFLIRRRGYGQYERNPTQQAKERFLTNLSAEWAGLPSGPEGKSYYAGVGNNKAHVGWDVALAAFADGGVVNKPTIGLLAEKPGLQEAVIPMKQGNVPVSLNTKNLIDQMAIKQVEIVSDNNIKIQESFREIANSIGSKGVTDQTVEKMITQFAAMNEKLMDVIDVLNSSKDIQGNLLSYSMN